MRPSIRAARRGESGRNRPSRSKPVRIGLIRRIGALSGRRTGARRTRTHARVIHTRTPATRVRAVTPRALRAKRVCVCARVGQISPYRGGRGAGRMSRGRGGAVGARVGAVWLVWLRAGRAMLASMAYVRAYAPVKGRCLDCGGLLGGVRTPCVARRVLWRRGRRGIGRRGRAKRGAPRWPCARNGLAACVGAPS